MTKILKLIYYKWIKRACPHFCILCEFKDWCLTDGIAGLMKDLKTYSEK